MHSSMVKQQRHVEDVRQLSCSYQGEIRGCTKSERARMSFGDSYLVCACAVLSTRIRMQWCVAADLVSLPVTHRLSTSYTRAYTHVPYTRTHTYTHISPLFHYLLPYPPNPPFVTAKWPLAWSSEDSAVQHLHEAHRHGHAGRLERIKEKKPRRRDQEWGDEDSRHVRMRRPSP